MNINRSKELKILGNKIRSIRESKKLSQFELATLCEISKSQIGRIERGEINPTYLTLLNIASTLDSDICSIMTKEV